MLSVCISLVFIAVIIVGTYAIFYSEQTYFDRQTNKEVKKEPEISEFKLELQNTTNFIRNNNDEIIMGLYESVYKPLVLHQCRVVAADGRMNMSIRFESLIVEHIKDNKLKLSKFEMMNKISRILEEDLDFKGFHISCYRSDSDEPILFLSWS